jgi:hypothetical protein
MLIYGTVFHSATVLAEKKAEPDDRLIRQAPSADAIPDHAPYIRKLQLSEVVITRDITVGGLVRLASGLVKRTYAGDKPPASVCPT